MIIDVHRDGVPDPEYYEEELDGEKVTQIRLVVGQANENSAKTRRLPSSSRLIMTRRSRA